MVFFHPERCNMPGDHSKPASQEALWPAGPDRELVSPLTAIRSVLEMLRDLPEMPASQRQHFATLALNDFDRLESRIFHHLNRK